MNHGEFIESPGDTSRSDFFFIEADEPQQVIDRAVELVADRIPRKFGFDPMNDIQLLTPMRRNEP